MTMCTMICDFMMAMILWYMNIAEVEISCQCRSIDFYLHSTSTYTFMPIPLLLFTKAGHWTTHTKIPPCQNTTYSKRICPRKSVPGWKGGSCCCLKAVRRSFFRHSPGFLPKKFSIFFTKNWWPFCRGGMKKLLEIIILLELHIKNY